MLPSPPPPDVVEIESSDTSKLSLLEDCGVGVGFTSAVRAFESGLTFEFEVRGVVKRAKADFAFSDLGLEEGRFTQEDWGRGCRVCVTSFFPYDQSKPLMLAAIGFLYRRPETVRRMFANRSPPRSLY